MTKFASDSASNCAVLTCETEGLSVVVISPPSPARVRTFFVAFAEISELNEDKEVVLAGEEVLQQILPYRKQADIWAVEAKRYEGNYKSFDARIKTFTTMIPIVE